MKRGGRSGGHRGERYGRWKITGSKSIDSGGNGEVWDVVDDSGQSAVIKLLKSPSQRERVARFKREIQFLLDYPKYPGILPIIDHHLSKEKHDVPWYVMPRAVVLRKALGADPEPKVVLQAIGAVADTLARLADEGVGHRDIKPDNLFSCDGEWLVGDFGLVTYPEVEPLTKHGRKVGPTDYLAPEMRTNPDTAKFGPADVYSLAKTLWVLLANRDLPLPGPHRAEDDMCALSNILMYPWSAELDRLIEQCTQHDPRARLSMREMSDELQHMLLAPPERSGTRETKELEQRIAAITEADRRKASSLRDFQNQIAIASHELRETIITPFANELAKKLLGFRMRSDFQQNHVGARLLERRNYLRAENYNWILDFPGGRGSWILVAASLCVEDEVGRCKVAALVHICASNGGRGSVDSIWEGVHDARIGAASVKRAFDLLRVGLDESILPLLTRVAQLIADDEDK